jgi:hypothetical protein
MSTLPVSSQLRPLSGLLSTIDVAFLESSGAVRLTRCRRTHFRVASAGYFAARPGIPVLAGRAFLRERHREQPTHSPSSAATFAARYWPGESASVALCRFVESRHQRRWTW